MNRNAPLKTVPSRMRSLVPGLTLALALLAATLLPLAAHAAPEEDAVLAPVNALFDAMAKHDAAAVKATAIPAAGMVLMRDGKPSILTIEAFAEHIAALGPARIEERIHSPLIRIDNDLAVVWAPFEFLREGKVDHCGTDLFNLVRTNGKWLIASVADTGGKNCPAQ